MSNKSIKTLKAIVIILAVCVFLFEAVGIYPLSLRYAFRVPSYESIRVASLVFLYITSIPFYIALFQAVRICDRIIENKPFSKANIYYFKIARNCAYPEAIFYLLGAVAAYFVTATVGTPAITLVVAMVIVAFCALIVGLACSVMTALFKRANEIQEENAMTI